MATRLLLMAVAISAALGAASPAWAQQPFYFWASGRATQRDFNGDHIADIVFRDPQSGFVGVLNSQKQGWSLGIVAHLTADWSILDVADYDGDFKPDLLVRSSSGANGLINGSTGARRDLPALPVAWTFQGATDFNNDGRADPIWRNGSTGEMHAWVSLYDSHLTMGMGKLHPSFTYAGSTIGSNGVASLYWEQSADGVSDRWVFRPEGIHSVTFLSSFPGRAEDSGDVSGDGGEDLIIRAPDGQVTLIYEDGIVDYAERMDPAEWTLVAVDEFSGDGRADFLWRRNTGELRLWVNTPLAGEKVDRPVLLTAPQIEIR